MKWAVPGRLDVDLVCAAWAIHRFVDDTAVFVFLPEGEPPLDGAVPIAAPRARTTSGLLFEAVLECHHVADPIVWGLVPAVAAAAAGTEQDPDSQAYRIDVMCRGLVMLYTPERVIELALPQLDILYEERRIALLGGDR